MNFAEYLYFLLPSALKRTIKKLNQFWILFQVLGRHCEDVKKVILDVREMSMLLTCPTELLPIFGEERNMPRLKGETVDAYRNRLTMKAEIAKKAGTTAGILLAVSALGYDRSRIEPFFEQDPERWAEFIIFLNGKNSSDINDIRTIDLEVMKVKQASSKPSYGSESNKGIGILSATPAHDVDYPLCGQTLCGTYPTLASEGHQFCSAMTLHQSTSNIEFSYPLAGDIYCSETDYPSIEGGVL